MRTVAALLLLSLSAPAASPRAQDITISECRRKSTADDSLLRNALRKSVEAKAGIEFLKEEATCDHAKSMVNTLDRAAGDKSFSQADSHSFAFVRNNDNLFSIERFVFKDERSAAAVGEAFKRRGRNTLPLKAPTSFDFLQLGNNLVMFIADAHSFRFNEPLIAEIKQNLCAEYGGGK